LRHALTISTAGIVAIVVTTFALPAFTLILALLDRHFAEQLFHTNELLPLLLDSGPEAIWGIDIAGKCTFCNPEFLRLTGYASFDQVKGKNIHLLTHHTRADGSPYIASDCPIYQSLFSSESCHVDTEIFWRKDGTSFPVEYRSHPVERLGQIIGCVVTFVDITERKQTEKQLRDSESKHRFTAEAIRRIIEPITAEYQYLAGGVPWFKNPVGVIEWSEPAGKLDRVSAFAQLESWRSGMADQTEILRKYSFCFSVGSNSIR
jgi:PAS domain S-box-containing protein